MATEGRGLVTQKRYTILAVNQERPTEADEAAAPTAFASEADRVAHAVRDQIIDGTRAPGARLVERDIAAELAVSRIPVRDALKQLTAEGLVTPRPRTWAVVRTFTDADVEDLLEVRSAVETLTFRLAADRGSDEQLAVLREQLQEERVAAAAGDARRARAAGADFHETVVSMARNTVLSEWYATTRSRMRWLLGQHTALAEMAEEHAALYRALADHDSDRAGALAAAHLVTSRRALADTRRRVASPGAAR